MSTQEEQPWHAAYPAPRNTADTLPRHELLQWFRDGKQPGKDFVLVDLRRTDFEVYTQCCISGGIKRNETKYRM